MGKKGKTRERECPFVLLKEEEFVADLWLAFCVDGLAH
jgi:hypothetical protein